MQCTNCSYTSHTYTYMYMYIQQTPVANIHCILFCILNQSTQCRTCRGTYMYVHVQVHVHVLYLSVYIYTCMYTQMDMFIQYVKYIHVHVRIIIINNNTYMYMYLHCASTTMYIYMYMYDWARMSNYKLHFTGISPSQLLSSKFLICTFWSTQVHRVQLTSQKFHSHKLYTTQYGILRV